ncbi:urease accessory protein UreE [Chlorogloea sp. CCALA 695]|uniref:urease accessory protein UreE n=1 Tax=Chlorogloea sp. CCALA 695 TaxID=2107693 RepID=UPI000D071666|nr:urease accessory protein UreE [Chlorogloea sp. CCALA 695]PSB35522.1 urease accessory protein UreE [Chlorogloea sp. CCALA 695]
MLTLTQIKLPNKSILVNFSLALTAEERTRSRHRFTTVEGEIVYLHLPRGTVLQDGDLLQDYGETILVRVSAKLEPVITVTTTNSLELLKAAYHLGNRHVLVEISTDYLRLAPDPVLQKMLEQLNFEVISEIMPFFPEQGAYKHHSDG